MLIVSGCPSARVNRSVGQLKGGSILRVTVVGKGPALRSSRVLFMGMEATPFSQRYLKYKRGSLKPRLGVINSPVTFVLNGIFGFLSPPMVAWHCQFSRTLPTLNELALN